MNKKVFLKTIILILTLCVACCALFACNEKPDDTPEPTPTPTPEPEPPKFYEAKEGYEYGEDVEITYRSQVTNDLKHAYVTMPANYDESKKYPVLYLLHGMACTHKSWLEMCNAKYVVQNLVIEENVKEMIIVSVNSIVTEGEIAPSTFSEDYCTAFDKTGEDIITSLMPYVNEHYSTLTDRKNTAIAGFSMGGRETLLTAFAYQDYFNYVGAFSPSGFGKNAWSNDTTVPDFKYEDGKSFDVVMIAVGTLDGATGAVFPYIDKKLTENEIEHISKKYFGTHDPNVWRAALFDFVQLIFTEN